MKTRWLGWYMALAGAMDATTGLLIAFAPELALSLMGIDQGHAGVFFRWLGVFIAGVGAAYWLPWLAHGQPARAAQQRLALALTALVRSGVFLFTAWAVWTGRLEPAWLTVTAVDGLCAAFQTTILAKGDFS